MPGCQEAEPGADDTEWGREGGGLDNGEVDKPPEEDKEREWGESFHLPGT